MGHWRGRFLGARETPLAFWKEFVGGERMTSKSDLRDLLLFIVHPSSSFPMVAAIVCHKEQKIRKISWTTSLKELSESFLLGYLSCMGDVFPILDTKIGVKWFPINNIVTYLTCNEFRDKAAVICVKIPPHCHYCWRTFSRSPKCFLFATSVKSKSYKARTRMILTAKRDNSFVFLVFMFFSVQELWPPSCC